MKEGSLIPGDPEFEGCGSTPARSGPFSHLFREGSPFQIQLERSPRREALQFWHFKTAAVEAARTLSSQP